MFNKILKVVFYMNNNNKFNNVQAYYETNENVKIQIINDKIGRFDKLLKVIVMNNLQVVYVSRGKNYVIVKC